MDIIVNLPDYHAFLPIMQVCDFFFTVIFNFLFTHYQRSWASFHVYWLSRVPFMKYLFKCLSIFLLLSFSCWFTGIFLYIPGESFACLCYKYYLYGLLFSISLMVSLKKQKCQNDLFKNINILTLLCLKFINDFPSHLKENTNS